MNFGKRPLCSVRDPPDLITLEKKTLFANSSLNLTFLPSITHTHSTTIQDDEPIWKEEDANIYSVRNFHQTANWSSTDNRQAAGDHRQSRKKVCNFRIPISHFGIRRLSPAKRNCRQVDKTKLFIRQQEDGVANQALALLSYKHREEHLQKKIDQIVKEAKLKMSKGDKKGK